MHPRSKYPKYTISKYPKYCSRIRDYFSGKPCAGKITQPSSFESGTIQACQGGTQRNFVERCNQYLSNLFLVTKKGWGKRPVINLKHLNNFIPYQHFKMEGLNLLQNMFQKGNYMCKVDLKDTYFCVPLKKESRKYVQFQWEETLYEFPCLCLGLGPVPLIYTNILKVPISL